MLILKEKISLDTLSHIEEETYFDDLCMIKAVVDINLELIARRK